jgi:hypothetical protein
MSRIIYRHYSSLNNRARLDVDHIINSLFHLFDEAGNGFCDVRNLATALTLYCGGNASEKASAIYTLLKRHSYISMSSLQESNDQPIKSAPPRTNAKKNGSSIPDGLPAERLCSALYSLFRVADTIGFESSLVDANDIALDITVKAYATAQLEMYKDELLPRQHFENCIIDTLEQYFPNTVRHDRTLSRKFSKRVNIECISPSAYRIALESEHRPNIISPLMSIEDIQSFCNGTMKPSNPSNNPSNFNSKFITTDVIEELRAARKALGLESFTAQELYGTISEYAEDLEEEHETMKSRQGEFMIDPISYR